MTTTQASPVGTAATVQTRRYPVWAVSTYATIVGAVVLLAYGAAAIGVLGSQRAGDPGASHSVALNAGSYAIGTLFSGALGIALAAALARWAKTPATTYVRTSVALVLVSLVMPLAASHTELSTKLSLAVGHVLAAAVIVPIVARRLRAS
jgi:hypothetical protein